jgi:hypothetical protein
VKNDLIEILCFGDAFEALVVALLLEVALECLACFLSNFI